MSAFSKYKRLVFKPNEQNAFILPWAKVLIRNVKKNGEEFVSYKTIKEYRKKKQKPWILCSLVVFKEGNDIFPVFQCEQCPKMKCVDSFSMNQSSAFMETYKCDHSRIADIVVGRFEDWQTVWPVDYGDINNADEAFKVECNEDIEYVTLVDEFEARRNGKSRHLAAVYLKSKRKVSVLATLTQKAKMVTCFLYSTKKCKCYRIYKDCLDSEHDGDDDFTHYGDRRRYEASRQDHYEEDPPFPHLGYNRTKFKFPLFR